MNNTIRYIVQKYIGYYFIKYVDHEHTSININDLDRLYSRGIEDNLVAKFWFGEFSIFDGKNTVAINDAKYFDFDYDKKTKKIIARSDFYYDIYNTALEREGCVPSYEYVYLISIRNGKLYFEIKGNIYVSNSFDTRDRKKLFRHPSTVLTGCLEDYMVFGNIAYDYEGNPKIILPKKIRLLNGNYFQCKNAIFKCFPSGS